MDRGAWWAIVHVIPRVGHDLAIKTKPMYINTAPKLPKVSQAADVMMYPLNSGLFHNISMAGMRPPHMLLEKFTQSL